MTQQPQSLIDELAARLDGIAEEVAEQVVAAKTESEIEKILRKEILKRLHGFEDELLRNFLSLH